MPEAPAAAAIGANPYVGATPFTAEQRDRFFGRSVEIRQLTSLIVAHREVVLHSQSGAGKTSLLKAGVYPRLEERGFEVLPLVRVAGASLDASQRQMIANVYAFNVLRGWAREGTDPASLYTATLAQYLSKRNEDGSARKRLRIIILDQFEELFTTYPERWQDREAFLVQVAEALEQDRTLRVVFALREEYLGRLRRFGALFPGQLRQWFQLERLRARPALEAVILPAAGAGRTFQDGVAEGIVDRLVPIRVRREDGAVEEIPGEFVEPVHLQIVCHRLWQQLPTDQKDITFADVKAHGDVDRALREYYEKQIGEVAIQRRMSRRRLRRWFEHKFITDDGRRARVFEKEGRVGGQPLDMALDFQRRYLLRSDSQGDAAWFEIAHDRLLGPIQMVREDYRRRVLPLQIAAALVLIATGFIGGWLLYRRQVSAAELARATVRDREAVDLARRVSSSDRPSQYLHDALALTLRAYPVLDRMREATALKDTLQYAVNGATLAEPAASAPRAVAPGGTPAALRLPFQIINSAAFSPNGRYLAVFGAPPAAPPVVALVDTQSATILGHRPQLRGVFSLFAADPGQRIAFIQQPGVVTAYDVAPARQQERAKDASPRERPRDEQVKGIDSRLGPQFKALEGGEFSPGLLALALGAGGRYVAASAWDGTTKIWDAQTKAEKRTFTRQSKTVWDVALDPKESVLATAHDDGTIALWNVETGEQMRTWKAHGKEVRRVAFSPAGDYLATAGWDDLVKLWALPSGVLRHTYTGHTRPVNAVSFSPSGDRLATAASDGTIKVWGIRGGPAQQTFRLHKRSVRQVAFSSDGRLLASAGADRMAVIADAKTGAMRLSLKHQATVWSAAFSPDSAHVVTSGEDGRARIWDVASGKLIAELGETGGARAPISEARFDRSGQRIITVSSDDTCRWWEWRAGKEQARVWGHSAAIISTGSGVTLHPSGEWLASVDSTGLVTVTEAATQKPRNSFRVAQTKVSAIAYGSTGAALITAGTAPQLAMWDPASGKLVDKVETGESVSLSLVAADARDMRIAAGGAGAKPVVWSRGREPSAVQMAGPAKRVRALALSPGGELLATVDQDTATHVWNATSGRLIAAYRPTGASGVAFDAKGTVLMTIGHQGLRSLRVDDFFEPDMPRLMARAFELLPEDSELHGVIALALRGEVATAIKRLGELKRPEDRDKAASLRILERLQGGTFTPLDLREYFER